MQMAKELPCLRELVMNKLLIRLVIPLMFVAIVAIFVEGYLAEKNLEKKQDDVAKSISHIIDNHLDHSERIIDTIARVSEKSTENDLSFIMESALDSFEYFDTIYLLDKNKKITLMEPYNSRYKDLDLSNIPDFKSDNSEKAFNISHPFISIRTGEPTVYIVRHLTNGGCVVGELKLNLFQKEITNISKESGRDFVFIMDQRGTVLAHPSSDLVKEQINMSNLGIFKGVTAGKKSDTYFYNGSLVIGSAAISEKTGWIVVNQVSFAVYGTYLFYTLGLIIIASIIIWVFLAWNLGKWIQKYITEPMDRLSGVTTALTSGNFKYANQLSSISSSSTFAELNKLSLDFKIMSDKLHFRENALLESEKRYHSLFDGVPIGLFRVSEDGEVLEINKMLVSMLGYSNHEELLKIRFWDLLRESLTNNMLQLPTRNLINFETDLCRYDGKIITVQINVYITSEPDEVERHFEGSIEDISKRKQIENKVKEQQQCLLEAEKAQRETLEKALAMKDEFISLISHELRTPLNVIYSALQLIDSVYIKSIPERVRGLLGNIKQNTFRQLRLSNNLLDVTRLNSGQYKLNIKNIDIIHITKIITKSVEIYSERKNIEICFKSDIKSKIICIDEEKYECILLNLISNAIKFTESNGRIIISVEEDETAEEIQIKVIDTGIGIPKDKKEMIFERFGQVDNKLSRCAEGAGIGLSLVKLLVKTLGGSINVESEIGVGSTFTLLLPAKKNIVNITEDEGLEIEDRIGKDLEIQFSDIYF